MDWTRSETISTPDEIIIDYTATNAQGQVEKKQVILISTPRSINTTEHMTFDYVDSEGKEQTKEVVTRQLEERRTTVAAVNPAYISWRLSNGLGLPSGDVWSVTDSISEYILTSDGPRKVREYVSDYMSEWQLAGSLAIEKYNNFVPTADRFEASRTVSLFDEWKGSDGRIITRTRISRWTALGLIQEGSQAVQRQLRQLKSFLAVAADVDGANLRAIVDSAKKLIFEGTEVQIPEMPTSSDRIADEIVNGTEEAEGTDPNIDRRVNNQHYIEGIVTFDETPYDPAGDAVVTTYEMPFAPDDIIEYLGTQRLLVAGQSEEAAKRFGETEAAFDLGHAYGYNIVSSFDNIPSLPLAPVYVQMAEIEGAFLLDSVSYAWGSEGMVVSSDLMLLGVTGRYGSTAPSASWIRIPVDVGDLQSINMAGTIEANPQKANTITLPGNFNPRNPASTIAALPTNGSDVFREWRNGNRLVRPTLQVERNVLTTKPTLRSREFPYSLIPVIETQVLTTQPVLVVRESRGVTPPDGLVAVTGLAPSIRTGAAIRPPVAAIQVAAVAPTIATSVTVAVPVASITVAIHAPAVEASGIVQVPTAQISVEGLVPTIETTASAGKLDVGLFPLDPLFLFPD